MPPVLEPAKHDLYAVALLVSALVVFDRCLTLLSTGDAGSYPLVLQRFPEPVGVIAAIPEQPIDLWEAAEQRPRSDVVADLSCGDEQVERAALAVTDGMQLRVHAALGSADEASTPPFFAAKLVAVRCAFR